MCGGMRGHGLNVSILALNMYVILQLFFIKCVSKTPGLRTTIKCHLVINMLKGNLKLMMFSCFTLSGRALFLVVDQHFVVGDVFRWVGAQPEITTPSSGLLCRKTMNQEVLCTILWCFKVRTLKHATSQTLTHAHTGYVNLSTGPGYSKVTPPFYSAYKNQHFYLIREHNRKRRPGTRAPLKPHTYKHTHLQVEGLQTGFTGPGTVRYYTVKI